MGVKDFLFSSVDFYFRVLVSKITKGSRDRPSVNLSDNELYFSTNRIYTKDKVKKMFFVNELPRLVDEGFIQDIKAEVQSRVYDVNKQNGTSHKCELIDIVKADPYEVNFHSVRGRTRLRIWERRYKDALKNESGKNAVDEMLATKEETETKSKNRWMIESFMYVNRVQNEEKGRFAKTNLVFELVADDDEMLKQCEKQMEGYFYQHDIKYREVFLQANEYYKAFSPVGSEDGHILAKMNAPYVLSDEVLASFDEPTYGMVGDPTGLYMGNDIYTGLPTFYDLFKGSDAQNILIAADSGKGKSNYIKGLYMSLDLNDIRTVMLDYEGDEYSYIGKAYDAETFKVSGEESKYFNTIVIGDLTGVEEIDKNLKQEAVKSTERVFSLLASHKHGMDHVEKAIFSDCVNRVFEKFGVTDDRETWKNSKGITYFHLYGELKDMVEMDNYIREYGEHLKAFIVKLKIFFEEGGINNSMFKNPMDLDEMLGVKHVIFSFGNMGQDEAMTDPQEMALKQLFVGYITTLISNYNRSKGKLTAVMFEEVQRYLTQEHSASLISNIVTGGRKRGMITFLITNSPNQIVSKTDDSMSADKREHINAIRGNITGMVIGALKNDHSREVAEYFNVESALESMYLINKGGSMKFSFLLCMKGETSIVKHLFHPDLINTDLYETRKDKKEDGDETE